MGAFLKYGIPFGLAALQTSSLIASRYLDKTDPDAAFAAYAAGTVVGLGSAGLAALNAWRADWARVEAEIKIALHSAYSSLQEMHIVKPEEIGLHVYRVRTTMRHPFAGEQKRIVRLRPKRALPPSRIRWTKGKGVVGRCWASHGNIVWWRLQTHHADHVGCTPEQWADAPEHLQMGFSFEDWEVAQRYKGVIAVPMVRERETNHEGCVTLDCATDEAYLELEKNKAAVETLLQDMANAVLKKLDL